MAEKPVALDHWREYFRSADSDIFYVIEQAIMVAASDCPKEFRVRRDRIAELLFSCHTMTRCTRCDTLEEDCGDDLGCKSGFVDGIGSKDDKSNSSRDDQAEMHGNQQVSNYSYGEAEALTDEMDEENQVVGEVLRIKGVLQNFADQPDSVLFDSLRRLQLMDLNVDILKATEIGKAVASLRKCESKGIRQLAKKLIEGWKTMVDQWVETVEKITDRTPESMNQSIVDDGEGLPSPPLDEGAFFPQQNMELSQFFDGMDDDGNPRSNNREFNKNREGGSRLPVSKQRERCSIEGTALTKELRAPQIAKQEAAVSKPINGADAQFGPGRPIKPTSVPKVDNEAKVQPKPYKPTTIQRRPAPQTEKSSGADEVAVKLKLEASKRKLQELYKQAENAKRQKTIQVMEVHDLPKAKPKQGLGQKNSHGRSSSGLRRWVNGPR